MSDKAISAADLKVLAEMMKQVTQPIKDAASLIRAGTAIMKGK